MREMIEELRRALELAPEVQLAVLFGSHAHHAAAEASDVDVGILLETGRDRPPALQVTLERALGRVLDIIWLDDAPPLLRLEIARDGLVAVERAPGAWAAFQAHALIDWWDWVPTARMIRRTLAARLQEEASRGPS